MPETPDTEILTEEDKRNAIITTITLDVSNKHLKEVPKTIKNFTNIEFLYLSNNDIKTIPDNFFQHLPQLKWLDFRHNLLVRIPAAIGDHRELRTLLLQGNKIQTLPIEIGNIPTLTGLNIADNPLSFPPGHILTEGTQKILHFLRQELQNENLLLPELEIQLADLSVTEQPDNGYLGSGEEEQQREKSRVRVVTRKSKSDAAVTALSHKSATLVSRTPVERKWSTGDTIITTKPRLPKTRKKFKSATAISRVSHSDHYIQKISQAMREYEEKRMVAIRQEENSRTEMMIQRMRDREALKQWRQQMLSTPPSSKARIQTVPEPPKRSATVVNNKPTTLSSKEEALRNRIREHAVKLREFHKNDKSSGTKVVATENLKEANVIHSEMQRFNQEYRFKAFTGEFMD